MDELKADEEKPEEKKPAKVRVALLDKERGVYRGMVEVDEADLGPQHLPQVTECDLAPGEYRWDEKQECFVPLPRTQRAPEAAPTLEHALAFTLLLQRERDPALLADVALDWLDAMVQSVDFKAYRQTPLIAQYAQLRGIVFKGG